MYCYSHNPYFNRWFSAIVQAMNDYSMYDSHNPYFNRWFSVICITTSFFHTASYVTILILIDGFLQ